MFESVKEDVRIFSEKHADQGWVKFFYYPEIRCVLIFRLSQWCFAHRLKVVAYFLTNLNDFLHGVWIGPKVSAAAGLFLGHPRGIVINPGTKIGRYCTIINQVTIGGPSVTIGDYVEIGAGAKVISSSERAVEIGAHSIIGAGAVVVTSCAPCSVLAGVPAKVVKTKDMVLWRARHPYYRGDELP